MANLLSAKKNRVSLQRSNRTLSNETTTRTSKLSNKSSTIIELSRYHRSKSTRVISRKSILQYGRHRYLSWNIKSQKTNMPLKTFSANTKTRTIFWTSKTQNNSTNSTNKIKENKCFKKNNVHSLIIYPYLYPVKLPLNDIGRKPELKGISVKIKLDSSATVEV